MSALRRIAVSGVFLVTMAVTAQGQTPPTTPSAPIDFLTNPNMQLMQAQNPPSGNQPANPPAQPTAPADQQPMANPAADQFAQAPQTGAEAPVSLSPPVMGDFCGMLARVKVFLPETIVTSFQQTTTTTTTTFMTVTIPSDSGPPFRVEVPVTSTHTVTQTITNTTTQLVARVIEVPTAGCTSVKIADNESPRPEDRVYFSFHYYSGLSTFGAPAQTFAVDPPAPVVTSTVTEGPSTITTFIPGVPNEHLDLYTETIGFEKLLFGNNLSVGMRVPVFQTQGDGSLASNDFGDLSVILKYAPYNDLKTGNVFCLGLVVTAPTAPSIDTIDGNVNSTYLQPFLGYVWGGPNLYVQGFTSVAVPTDSRDVLLLFNDVSVGYQMYRGPSTSLVTSIIPAIEAHVTTPLDNRGADAAITGLDMVVLEGGVHLGLGDRSLLSLGVAAPVTGPRPYDIEAIAEFNFRF